MSHDGVSLDAVCRWVKAFQAHGPACVADAQPFLAPLQHPTAFAIPGLPARPFWDLPLLTGLLEAHVDMVAEEFRALRDVHRESIKAEVASGQWDVVYLLEEGLWHNDVCMRCPQTMALLKTLPICDSRCVDVLQYCMCA